MANTQYDEFIRIRITELRIAKNISEHKMIHSWYNQRSGLAVSQGIVQYHLVF